jgi:DNA-binding PucR family transcriptional regulator
LDDSNSRVAMTVNSPLVAFWQAEPSLKIEIVLDLLELSRADKKAGQEAGHQRGHVLANRILSLLELIDQLLELLLAIRLTLPSGFESRGYLLDVLDVFSE